PGSKEIELAAGIGFLRVARGIRVIENGREVATAAVDNAFQDGLERAGGGLQTRIDHALPRHARAFVARAARLRALGSIRPAGKQAASGRVASVVIGALVVVVASDG